MKDLKFLRSRCIRYFASIVDVSVEQKIKPGDIHIVIEFLQAFPHELLGLPPDREIDFVIDVLPSTTPLSKASYCISCFEFV